jgi:hypothetical protein
MTGSHEPGAAARVPVHSSFFLVMEGSMAKGQQRSTKEKKKPKSDKNKKKKHMPFGGHTPAGAPDHPGFNPFAKKA